MKRDMDLLRDILLAIEASPTPELLSVPVFPAFRREIVIEHMRLLHQMGYISAQVSEGDDTIDFGWIRLESPGYDFLDLARDNGTWNKAKAYLGRAFETAGIPAIIGVLVKLAGG